MTIPQNIKEIIEFLKTIGAFAGLGGLLRWFFKLYTNRLSLRERELLVAAWHGDNNIICIKVPGMGTQWIRAGKRDLGNEAIPSVEFIDALDKLVVRGLVRWVSGDMYCLSGSGIKRAKALAQSIDISSIPCEQIA